MSLYIGKDNSNTATFHLTSSIDDLARLKLGPYTNTVFHSNLQYLSYKVYTPLSSEYIPDTIKDSTSYYVGGISITVSQDFIDTFNSNNTRFYFILLDNSDTGLRYSFYKDGDRSPRYSPPFCMWYSSPPSASTNNGLYKGETPYPTNTNRYGYICSSYNTSNIKLIVTNYTDDGVLFNYKINNNISITKSSFTIGGVDISSYPYITKYIINNIDTIINLNGTQYQLCNNNSSGTFELTSPSYIQLKVGSKIIADSRYNNNLLSNDFRSLVWYDLNVGAMYSITTDLLSDKSIVQLSYTTAYVIGTGERIFNTKLISYSEGKVIPMLRTNVISVDLVCTGGVLYVRFNTFWTSSYSNFVGIKHRVFN